MSFFRPSADLRRKIYLALAGSVESQLRDVYAKKHELGKETQASLARKIGVSRSAINKRLSGQNNITLETLADLVWALEQCIKVEIFDPVDLPAKNHPLAPDGSASSAVQVVFTRSSEASSSSESVNARFEIVH